MVRADFRGIKSRNQRSTSVQKVNCKAGKPLDYAPLTIIPARAIGLMTMMDTGKKDRKVIAVATSGPEFNAYHEASQLPPHRLRVLRRFFLDYKQLEKKIVEVEEIASVEMAYPVIEDALNRYSNQRQRGFRA